MIKNIYIYLFAFIAGFIISAFLFKYSNIELLVPIMQALVSGIILGLIVKNKSILHGVLMTILIFLFYVGVINFSGMVKHPEYSGDYFQLYKKNWNMILIIFCPIFTYYSNKIKQKKKSSG